MAGPRQRSGHHSRAGWPFHIAIQEQIGSCFTSVLKLLDGLGYEVSDEQLARTVSYYLDSDVADVQGGTTAEGIHLGAMAGTVDLVLRCLTGLRARGPVVRFEPALPPQVKSLRFRIHYRGYPLDVAFAEGHVTIGSRPGVAGPITVLVRDESVELRPRGQHEFPLNPEA